MVKYRFKRGAKNKLIAYAATAVVFVITLILLVFFAIPKITEALDYYSIKDTEPQSGEYTGEKLHISYERVKLDGGRYVLADIVMQDMNCIKTAFAGEGYSKYSLEDPLVIASENAAILAINADNSCYSSEGLLIRGSRFYSYSESDADTLLFYHDGTMKSLPGTEFTGEEQAGELIRSGVTNSFCGGESIISGGKVEEKTPDWEDKDAYTCIGMIEAGHYVVIVSDSNSAHTMGMTKNELASAMYKLGCIEAYILEDGTECILIFENNILNNLCGRKAAREISDIIYFAE